jgi:hypothetical protein
MDLYLEKKLFIKTSKQSMSGRDKKTKQKLHI